MPARYKAGAATSYRFAAVGLTGYVGKKIVQYAYPTDPPSAAVAVITLFALAIIVGVAGFLAVRTRMYLKGDDLAPKGS